MNRSLTFKLGTIGLLMLLLLIPIQMINGIISERQQHRDTVLTDIARSSSYQQHITGPILVVPYRKTEREWKQRNGHRFQEERAIRGQLYFLPETFLLNGTLRTEVRARGIYQARLYHAKNTVSGSFQLPENLGVSSDFADYSFEKPFLALGINDIRGIENGLSLRLNGNTLPFEPGSRVAFLGDGVHAALPVTVDGKVDGKKATLEFAFDLDLQGTGQLDITPVGRESRVNLVSDWPHPSFVGDYLPVSREVSTEGFDAQWQTSFFSTNLREALDSCTTRNECTEFNSRRLGVSLLDPVDQYLKSDRAIKYALLFIALTFAGFFLFEILKRLAVHPVQYGLVGLSLAIFYLLLLSLAEHLGFALAYGLSASACVLLIGFYVGSVLRQWRHGAGFSAALAALYGLLYGLLSAEDYALLMGSLLVFGVLGLFMMLTRKVDWFTVGRSDLQDSQVDAGSGH